MKTILPLLLLSCFVHAQNSIYYRDGKKLKAATVEVGDTLISYTRSEKDKTIRYLSRLEVDEIIGHDGNPQKIEHPAVALDNVKADVLRLLNAYARDHRFDDALKAEFEGEKFLRLTPWNPKKDKAAGSTRRYDFSLIYKFEIIDVKSDAFSVINIVTSGENAPSDTGKKERVRLLLGVENQKNAALLLGALKELNRVLAPQSGNLPADSK